MIHPSPHDTGRVVCWFSCGAASAVAAKLALSDFGEENVVIAYTDTRAEHPDNKRFLRDCEEWVRRSFTILTSQEFKDTWDVWTRRRYVGGIAGAPCTTELKKSLRQDFQNPWDDIQVFGYTVEEQKRADRFQEQNPEANLDTPLIRHGLTKSDCLAMVERAGIELPKLYKLGFRNNNCIPCSKAKSVGYWRLIREHFPAEFERYAALCDELGVRQLDFGGKRRSLRDLDEAPTGRYKAENIECSLLCESAESVYTPPSRGAQT